MRLLRLAFAVALSCAVPAPVANAHATSFSFVGQVQFRDGFPGCGNELALVEGFVQEPTAAHGTQATAVMTYCDDVGTAHGLASGTWSIDGVVFGHFTWERYGTHVWMTIFGDHSGTAQGDLVFPVGVFPFGTAYPVTADFTASFSLFA